MAELSQREAFGKALASYGEVNNQIVVLDADTSSSTFSNFFSQRFPRRFLNIGIAEPCMIDVAVGLALGGLIPFVNGFSALLALRALEQVRTNICYARTNVKLAASYAGLSDYKDGPTHHSITDIAIMRSLPEMTVIVPADAEQISAWVPVIASYEGPVYLRLNRSATLPVSQKGEIPEIGKAIRRRDGKDLTIIAAGAMVGRSLQAASQLAEQGISAGMVEMHTIKPLDTEAICKAAQETEALVVAEEHSVIGGLGAAVAETLVKNCPVPVAQVGLDDTFTRTAHSPEELMDAYGLAVEDIFRAGIRVLEETQAYK